MKKILISLLVAIFMSSGLSYASVWVVYKDSKVYSLSEQNDAVVPQGYTTVVLKGTIDELGLVRPIDEYLFDGKNFKPDATKIKAKEDAVIAAEQKRNKQKADKESAKAKLKALGLTDDEIEAIGL